MPSDGSGNYTLAAGYLAVTGETIVISQHNPVLEDIRDGLSARVMASGARPMTGPLKLADGTEGAPSLALASQPTWGLFKTATGLGLSISATEVADFTGPSISLRNSLVLHDGGDIASANALALGLGNVFNITGTTAVTSIATIGVGAVALLRFDASLVLTYHATDLILPSAQNITTLPGDCGLFEEYAAGKWRLLIYQRANGTALTLPRTAPQGRLTLTSGVPVLAATVSGTSTVYYTPYVGNNISIYDGSSFVTYTFAELSMVMSGANFAANAIYDLFVANDSGTLRLCIGPAWATATAGAGDRGTGAGTTELELKEGMWTNKVSMTARYASGSTFSVAANQGSYVGSLFMDGTNSEVSCHLSYGQGRKWGLWNAYNAKQIIMKAGSPTASWTYQSATIRQSNGSTSNTITIFCGLAESIAIADFRQNVSSSINGVVQNAKIGIGLNVTNAFSSFAANTFRENDVTGVNLGLYLAADYVLQPSIGINTLNMNEQSVATAATTFLGTEANMLMTASYWG